jgi:hypothetical protein
LTTPAPGPRGLALAQARTGKPERGGLFVRDAGVFACRLQCRKPTDHGTSRALDSGLPLPEAHPCRRRRPHAPSVPTAIATESRPYPTSCMYPKRTTSDARIVGASGASRAVRRALPTPRRNAAVRTERRATSHVDPCRSRCAHRRGRAVVRVAGVARSGGVIRSRGE